MKVKFELSQQELDVLIIEHFRNKLGSSDSFDPSKIQILIKDTTRMVSKDYYNLGFKEFNLICIYEGNI